MKSPLWAGFLIGLLISTSACISTANGGIDDKDSSKELPPAPVSWCQAPSAFEIRIGVPGFVSAISGDFGAKGVVTNLDLSIDKVVSHINEFPIALSVSCLLYTS